MFRGAYAARVDEKGRLEFPSAFKRVIDEKYGHQFNITSLDGRVVQVYPSEEWERIEAKLASISTENPTKRKFLSRVNYWGQSVEMDGLGRVLLPQLLRESARAEGDVVVSGMVTFLEVANRDALEKQLENALSKVKPATELVELVDHFDGKLLLYPEVIPVALDFQQILRETYDDPRRLLELNPRQFEELVADIWRKFGYDVELTKQTRDGGRDVIAVKHAELNSRVLIECKRYSMSKKVDVNIVRRLYGVKVDECATKAILATTSGFTKNAKQFFQRHTWELEPRDYNGIVEWLGVALRKKSF